jgi:hypothetical protein
MTLRARDRRELDLFASPGKIMSGRTLPPVDPPQPTLMDYIASLPPPLRD